MFFKNAVILMFVKFLWLGLIFGVVRIVFKFISKIFRKNVFIVNILSFIFWLALGVVYFLMCFKLNSYSFSGIGLFGVVLGLLIIKISVEFFFDYFIRFIYNEFRNIRRKYKNGKLQTNKKIWKFC